MRYVMGNIFLFTGEERYLLDQELKRWKDGFQQKFGAETIFSYGPENFDPASMMQNILGGGLFVTKKLIIIKHVPTDGFQKIAAGTMEVFTEAFTKQLPNISADSLVVFVSYKPDKRTKFYKFLEKNAERKDFSSINDAQRKGYIKTRTPNITRESDAMDYLLAQVGSDLYRLESEVQKLVVRGEAHNQSTITKEHIDTVVFGQVEANAFALFDDIFIHDTKNLLLIDNMRENGTDRNQALGMMYRGIILFILMIDAYKEGIHDAKTISQRIGYQYFPISKQLPRIQKLLHREQDIRSIYKHLVELDVSIKTGKLPAEIFWIRVKDLLHTYARGNVVS